MRLHRASDYRRSRWKNGKGETLEIAVHPAAATLDDFDWRISAALLDVDADFSVFPGIDRTLAIIDGAGIVLRSGYELHRLDQNAPPLRFSGDEPARAELIHGRSADLNVMVRRGVADHDVRRAGAGMSLRGDGEFAGVFAVGEVELTAADMPISLARWDLLELLADETATIQSGMALLVHIRRANPTEFIT